MSSEVNSTEELMSFLKKKVVYNKNKFNNS
jgi:hypothetical protein